MRRFATMPVVLGLLCAAAAAGFSPRTRFAPPPERPVECEAGRSGPGELVPPVWNARYEPAREGRSPGRRRARRIERQEGLGGDSVVSDLNETDNDLPFEESLGSNAPFDGPSTNAGIGVGGAAGGGPFAGRGGHRNLRAMTGGKSTKGTVDLGLEWLKLHQDPDGRWDADGFHERCRLNRCGGPGAATADHPTTGLALLAFLGAGETHKHGRYKKVVKSALKYLKKAQGPEGNFGTARIPAERDAHAIATLAMCEAYGLTASPLFKQSAQAAVDFLQRSFYADTSASLWRILALRSAKAAKLRLDPKAMDVARAWLDRVTEPNSGRVYCGYSMYPPADLLTRTAAGAFCRVLTGEDPKKSRAIARATDLCLSALPREGAVTEPVYWYFATMLLFQVGGDPWKAWNAGLKDAGLATQRRDGDEKGSWDPAGPNRTTLGRAGATALMTMNFEVYYRYSRVFGTR